MHEKDSVETILARLMPPALSESGQRGIETMLDELAGPASPRKSPALPAWRILIAGGLAASLVAALALPVWMRPAKQSASATAAPPDFLLVGESDRIESMADEGWREDSDGSAMRALRVRVVEENSLFDEETGIVMQVSEPREELLLMPVSAF
ncbi:MAG: hypothetical protein EHM17_01040 [Verrucomicrobiaceae bacterium]|jgi:hypothetical protein|nr:MAG: hypothetical protein EHM17_14960 [Verrucomicrobiaceae bacterium]RPJ35851.1 MAG: hypothetical protein EHM17_01040 [Verrucomicrobiaceae bacterium]